MTSPLPSPSAQAARRALAEVGVTERDVWLTGEPRSPAERQGLVEVVKRERRDVQVVDRGMTRTLASFDTEEAALGFVVQRMYQVLPPPMRYGEDELVAANRMMAEQVVAPLRAAGRSHPRVTVQTTLERGWVLDRFGTVDGFVLYPSGTPMEQRSLPPDVLDPTEERLGLKYFGVADRIPAVARTIGPGFGQPGGGVMFGLDLGNITVRELLQSGHLKRLTVSQRTSALGGINVDPRLI